MALPLAQLLAPTVLVDDNVDGNKYIGIATAGSDTTAGRADQRWAILRISTSGTVKSISNARGNQDARNVWDNRTSLEYA
jgi:hypothetical protein